ncbi:MAG: hypothetical protein QY326_00665 [Bdellovibrionota bacterium]|nr:MAG: hypothetical protein QY326_00665 [Bdellovibrionota bacterium]
MGQAMPKSADSVRQPLIIQCPNCQTKFAIEPSLLDGIESPRFHCSRCDQVFSSQDAGLPSSPPPAPPPVHEEVEAPAEEERDFASLVDEMAALQDATSSQSHSESWHKPVSQSQSVATQAPSQMSLSYPKSTTIAHRVVAPHEREHEEQDRIAAQVDMFSVKPAALPPVQEDFSKYAVSFSEEERTFSSSPTKEFVRTPLPEVGPPISSAALLRPEKSGFQGLLAFALGLGGFLLLLAAFSMYLKANPQQGAAVAASLLPSHAEVPPATLYMRDTSLELVGLDNGETIHILSGILVNEGTEEFAEINLEGALFDERGEVMQRVLVPAASNLAKTKVRSLTRDAILEMQQGQLTRKFELPAGGKAPFAIAVPIDNDLTPRFYTGRVHSVRVER